MRFLSNGFRGRLASTREARGLTQTAFAKRVTEVTGQPMNQSRVSQLENGRADPSLEEVEVLARGLGITPGALAFGEGVGKRKPDADQPLAAKLPSRVRQKISDPDITDVERKRG